MLSKENVKQTLRQKISSRNFWNFAIASTIATLSFLHLLGKCSNPDGTYDHSAAYRYFDMWGSTIALFSVIFAGNGVLKQAVDKINLKSGANGGT